MGHRWVDGELEGKDRAAAGAVRGGPQALPRWLRVHEPEPERSVRPSVLAAVEAIEHPRLLARRRSAFRLAPRKREDIPLIELAPTYSR